MRSLGTSLTNTGDFLTLDGYGDLAGQQFTAHSVQQPRLSGPRRLEQRRAGGGGRAWHGLGFADRHLRAGDRRQSGAGAGRALQAQRDAVLWRQLYADHDGRLRSTRSISPASTATPSSSPTIFVPIPELDATKGFVADISNFLGQQFWTFIYPRDRRAARRRPSTASPGTRRFNLDGDGKPILSLQKLHFVYDPLAVLFTPNDLTHKYPLQPKQQVLALTNGQIQEGICWRIGQRAAAANARRHNICAQQNLPGGAVHGPAEHHLLVAQSAGQDRPFGDADHGDVGAQLPVRLRRCLQHRGVGALHVAVERPDRRTSFISQRVVGVEHADRRVCSTMTTTTWPFCCSMTPTSPTRASCSSTAISAPTGYTFSSPDHFDVNDVLPVRCRCSIRSRTRMGFDVAFLQHRLSLPRQFWSLTYDG